jgi:hypothetical protein
LREQVGLDRPARKKVIEHKAPAGAANGKDSA